MHRVRIGSVWRHHRSDDEVRVYTGRKCRGYKASPLGKPARFKGGRELVLEQYRSWLKGKLQDKTSPQAREILRISELVASGCQVTLLCWCAKDAEGLSTEDLPHTCHAQIIGEVVEKVAVRLKS
jgi:hypothetical protein